MNLPGHRIAACVGKAALNTYALQTLRDRRAYPTFGALPMYRRFPTGARGPAVFCRKTDQRKELPARYRQHLGGSSHQLKVHGAMHGKKRMGALPKLAGRRIGSIFG